MNAYSETHELLKKLSNLPSDWIEMLTSRIRDLEYQVDELHEVEATLEDEISALKDKIQHLEEGALLNDPESV